MNPFVLLHAKYYYMKKSEALNEGFKHGLQDAINIIRRELLKENPIIDNMEKIYGAKKQRKQATGENQERSCYSKLFSKGIIERLAIDAIKNILAHPENSDIEIECVENRGDREFEDILTVKNSNYEAHAQFELSDFAEDMVRVDDRYEQNETEDYLILKRFSPSLALFNPSFNATVIEATNGCISTGKVIEKLQSERMISPKARDVEMDDLLEDYLAIRDYPGVLSERDWN